jgi:hypothetical protein
LSADDVDDADAVGSPLEAVLVGEAVMVESAALEVELALGVAVALTLSVVELADDVAEAETELAVEDAETESVAVAVAVAAESDARVVVAEMETRVLTLEDAETELPGLLALKASASSGVSRMVIFSTTVVVSLMLVAGSRFSWRSNRARRG